MTTHYNIHIITIKADLKVTYRDGKWLNTKRLRGFFSQEMLDAHGKVIPTLESDIESFKIKYNGKAIYTIETVKPKTLLTQFTNVWFVFFKKLNNNISPKHEGAEVNALKGIIKHLKSINKGDEDAALVNWELILENWETLNEFHQKQTDLKYINSKLNVIIREIIKNNGGNASGTNGSVSL